MAVDMTVRGRSLRRFLCLLGCMLCGVLAAGAATQAQSIIEALPTLDPNLTNYPNSSLVDAASRLDAPAGKYGFVTAKDGHFVFGDGRRARFFGINLAKDSVFIEHEKIDALAALFARSGINLVRLHHIDDTTGILSQKPGEYFNAARLEMLDYCGSRS